MLFFAAPPPPPVSYSREAAPILAMRCNGCHGDAGGLSTRTYAGLMSGGNLGKVVIPGDAEGSLLIRFIDGRRGEAHRMPLGGRPLSPREIGTLRRWIDGGAREDAAAPPACVRQLKSVALPRDRTLRISSRVQTDAYVTIAIRDPRNRKVLLTRAFSVKSPREAGDAGSPGEVIAWDVRRASHWPKSLDLELRVEYAGADASGTEFDARLAPRVR